MIEFRPYQPPAIDTMAQTRRGICKAPAGSGKTIIMAAAADRFTAKRFKLARRRLKVAWVAYTTEQLDQGRDAVALFPALQAHAEITFACYAALIPLSGFDLVLLDEAHHIASPEFRKILDNYERTVWGFSATPTRDDEFRDDVFRLIGPIVHDVDRQDVRATGHITEARVIIHTPNKPGEFENQVALHADSLFARWRFGARQSAQDMAIRTIKSLTARSKVINMGQLMAILSEVQATTDASFITAFSKFPKGHPHRSTLWKMLTALAEEEIRQRALWIACQKIGIFENGPRNDLVVRLGHQHAQDSHLMIIGSIDHGNALQERIPGSVVVHSKLGPKKRRQAIENFKDGQLKTMIATSLADEGLDVPRANVLTLVAAGRSNRLAEQRTGRVLRAFHDKTHGTIHDFMDTSHYLLLAQSKKRQALYKQLGYQITQEGGLL